MAIGDNEGVRCLAAKGREESPFVYPFFFVRRIARIASDDWVVNMGW